MSNPRKQQLWYDHSRISYVRAARSARSARAHVRTCVLFYEKIILYKLSVNMNRVACVTTSQTTPEALA